MKTQLKILINTDRMISILDEHEKDITQQIEESVHIAIINLIKDQLCEEALNEYFFNCELEGLNYLCNSGLEDLSNLGNIKITMYNDQTKKEETLSEFENILSGEDKPFDTTEKNIPEEAEEETDTKEDDIIEEDEEDISIKKEENVLEEDEEELESAENKIEEEEQSNDRESQKAKHIRKTRLGIELVEEK